MTHRRAAIAAPNALSTDAAAHALAEGGTAVDAAIAAMVTTTVTEPGIVSPLGGCFVNVWAPGQEPVVVDGNVEMPGRAMTPDVRGRGLIEARMDYGGGMTTYVGPGSVATPGMFAAFHLAHQHFGAAPWAELMQPAADAARAGFPLGVTPQSYLVLVTDNILDWDPATRAVLTLDGAPLPVGHRIVDPVLAATLEHIGEAGATTIYRGDLSLVIDADMRRRGGLLTRVDLTAYQPIARTALRSRLGAWDLACNPPPSIGGPVLTALLRLLNATTGPLDPAQTATVMKEVLDFRLDRIDTSADLEAAGAGLLEALHEIGDAGLPRSASTAHVSVVDEDGMACALTASAGYGSGMTIEGTGLIANNALGELELNRLGLHALAPGKRLASNMAPTTARRDDGGVLAVGTPGADRITTALAQVLTHLARHGENIQEAIDRPRMHPRRVDDGSTRVDHEEDEGIAASLDAQGLPRFAHPRSAMYFGGVGAAMQSPRSGLVAAADARRVAATLVT